jgi:hypothetical protein
VKENLHILGNLKYYLIDEVALNDSKKNIKFSKREWEKF